MKCRNCKRTIDPDSRYCKRCGMKVVHPMRRSQAHSGQSKRMPNPAHDEGEDRKPTPLLPLEREDLDEEQHLWKGRPAWRAFSGSWMLWLGLSLGGLIVGHNYAGGDSPLVKVIWLFAGGAAVGLFIREAMIIYGLSYHLTTQRLFIHRGILTRVTDQMELYRTDDVRLRQGVVDRVMDTGNLEIFGTDETDDNVMLQSIPSPLDVAELLRMHVRAARAKDAIAVESI